MYECMAYMEWPVPERTPGEDDWTAFWNWHARRCAMCGFIDDSRLQRDHCHWTGRIRGLLCSHCNAAEANDGPDHPMWSVYRVKPPAWRFGVEMIYTNHHGYTPLHIVYESDPAGWGRERWQAIARDVEWCDSDPVAEVVE